MSIWTPIQLGDQTIINRFAMAPMTRGRARLDAMYSFVPDQLAIQYYGQRASGGVGLILTEGTFISNKARGWVNVPGIYTDEQEAGWKKVVDRVHEAPGAKFALQLWHMGRVTHNAFGNGQPWGPSAIAANEKSRTPIGALPCEVPHEMTEADIRATIADFVAASARAFKAGFDFVQVHGANGYLVQQFLSDKSNHRTDRYGGSAEKRATFLLEILDAMRAQFGSLKRVMLRLSPTTLYNDCLTTDPKGDYTTIVTLLQQRYSDLALLEIVEDRTNLKPEQFVAPVLRKIWKGPFGMNSGLNNVNGQALIDAGEVDIVSIGIPFLANPDLIKRYRLGLPLASPDFSKLFYTTPDMAAGYTDYPLAQ